MKKWGQIKKQLAPNMKSNDKFMVSRDLMIVYLGSARAAFSKIRRRKIFIDSKGHATW